MAISKLSTLFLGAFASILLAMPVHAQTWTMKISHAGPVTDNSDDHYGALKIQEYLMKHSGGRVKVEIYPASQLGSYKEVIEQLQAGSLEVAHTSIDGVAPFVPEFSLIDLPYSMPDDPTARVFMRGPFIGIINEGISSVLTNVELVAPMGGNWRSFYTTKKALNSAADLEGLKIRTINSPLQQEFVRGLNANPTVVAWGEVYTALGTGVVDGLKITVADIISNRLNDHVNYGILDTHTYLYGFFWVNKEWLASMPRDLQRIVRDAIVYGAEAQSDFNEALEISARDDFAKTGGKIVFPTEAQKAVFLEQKAIMEKWYLDKYGNKGKELLDKYKKAVAQAQAQAKK